MEEDQPIFQTSDLDDDIIYSSDSDDEPPQLQPEPLNHIIPDPYPSSSDPDDIVLPSSSTTTTTTTASAAVTVPNPSSFTHPLSAAVTTTAAVAPRPIDDSRKLFQRLWTDEDEIELLQGFLDYTATRGPTASGHYHDTGPFYDQIKNKLQLDFNKNQLVEKLRRLKKKYRVNLAKINSGKDFVFKSPHDHATFEISKKIWCNVSENTNRSGIAGVEFDFDDHNPNPNPSPNSIAIPAGTPPRPLSSSYVVSHINLNSASPGGGGGFDMMLPNWSGNGGGGLPKLCTRKRSRVASIPGKAEEKFVKTEVGAGVGVGIGISNIDNFSTNNDNNVVSNNAGVSPPLQGMVEETVRNCLSPVLKALIKNAVNGASSITGLSGAGGGGGGGHGFSHNPVPLNVEGVMHEKWRKQQILELEVYSKRLELVQEQIKLSLEKLRSTES